ELEHPEPGHRARPPRGRPALPQVPDVDVPLRSAHRQPPPVWRDREVVQLGGRVGRLHHPAGPAVAHDHAGRPADDDTPPRRRAPPVPTRPPPGVHPAACDEGYGTTVAAGRGSSHTRASPNVTVTRNRPRSAKAAKAFRS